MWSLGGQAVQQQPKYKESLKLMELFTIRSSHFIPYNIRRRELQRRDCINKVKFWNG